MNSLLVDWGSTSDVQTGFVGVLSNTMYSEAQGYGWVNSTASGAVRDPLPDGTDFANLLGTICGNASPRQFRIDLSPGEYEVTFFSGDMSATTGVVTRYSVDDGDTWVNGVTTLWGEMSAGEFTAKRFDVTLEVDEHLLLSMFRPAGSIWLSPGFLVRLKRDITILPLTLSAVAGDKYTFTGKATANATYIVETTEGEVISEDDDDAFIGTQVKADAQGNIEIIIEYAGDINEAEITARDIMARNVCRWPSPLAPPTSMGGRFSRRSDFPFSIGGRFARR